MPNKNIKNSHLLFDERPLIVRPELACRIGLNEAIFLQQVHYWLEIKRKAVKEKDLENEYTFRDGRFWTYCTYEDWQEQFPFWSLKTIQRIIKRLEDAKILLIDNYNKKAWDRTNWYSIDYDMLDATESKSFVKGRKININKKESSEKENNENKQDENKQEEMENILENDLENNEKNESENNVEFSNYPFPTDDDVPHMDNLTEWEFMHMDNLSECENTDMDNLSECDVMHMDNLTECIQSDCPNDMDNLTRPIPKNTYTKNTYTKNTLFNSSSSSNELNKKEEDKKMNLLKFMLEQSEIMPSEKLISETITLVKEKRLKFDVIDINLAIKHYKQKCMEKSIACPSIYFVNGFEMEINKRYTASLREKAKSDDNNLKTDIQLPNEVVGFNWNRL